MSFSADDLEDGARAATGLDDFGSSYYREGLERTVYALNTEAELNDLAESGRVLEEFLTSEVIVIGVAFYNFTVPSSLKAWVDRICVAGKTFSYGTSGVVGLARGKRVIVLLARGGIYGEGSPNARHEHAETYLRSIFSVIGIDNLEVIVADGVDISPELRAAALERAMDSIEMLAA